MSTEVGLAGVVRPGALCLAMLASLFAVLFGPQAARADEAPPTVAHNAIVIDAATGAVLYEKAADERVSPASLTKLFTALVAVESAPLDEPMTVVPEDLVGEASMGLRPGDEAPFEALLYGMLLASGNDAATAVARNIAELPGDTPRQAVNRFVDRTNARIQQLGLVDTHLQNPHGLDQEGHYSTAHDIAAIARHIWTSSPTVAGIAGSAQYRGYGYSLGQTNHLLGSYPGLLGGKTGYTEGAGYCLVEVAARDGRSVIVVLLGSTKEDWYSDAAGLLDYGFATLVPVGSSVTNTIQPAQNASSQGADSKAVVVAPGGGASIVSQAGKSGTSRSVWIVALTLGGAVPLVALGAALAHQERRRAPARRRSIVAPTPRRRFTMDLDVAAFSETAPFDVYMTAHAIHETEARLLARRAVTLATQRDFAGAARAFYEAARLDARIDLTTTPGFWSLCRRGQSAATTALVRAGRSADARSLSVVIQRGTAPAWSAAGAD